MKYFEHSLANASTRGDILEQGVSHTCIADVLVAQEGREKEAIKMYQKAGAIFESGGDQHIESDATQTRYRFSTRAGA